ncbi:MAG: hypothetical protein IBX50_14840 [Marinospirillum sp.]|uniref:hypothetical protein n=1 Tax=Marinospirillum sp. TaxID=2183934 RepID=UPI0019F56B6D|nr:hypothetical protein [Marinospirillum sp.]MBE0507966.1 hypothetical protein [Marinospirillum sp.]
MQEMTRYFRETLIDAGLGKAKFSDRELEQLEQGSRVSFSMQEGDAFFSRADLAQVTRSLLDDEEESPFLPLVIKPLVYRQKHNHCKTSSAYCAAITPVFLFAKMGAQSGYIYPGERQSVQIAREILSPLGDDALAIGAMKDVDLFLDKNQPPRFEEGLNGEQ